MINSVIVMGRLTRDPEVRYTQTENGNMAVARYSLACDRQTKDGKADFISVVAFGKNGEFAEKYLRKGMKIVIAGRLQTGSYKNKEGQTVYTTDVVVSSHDFADGKKTEEEKESTRTIVDSDGFMNIPDDIDEELPFV